MLCNNMVLMICSYSALSIAQPDDGHNGGRNMCLLAVAISATNMSIVVTTFYTLLYFDTHNENAAPQVVLTQT